MRSRYSAYARDDTAYLLHSWHPETRPARIEADPHLRWAGLEVLAATGGGLFDAEGVVEFRARYRERGRPGEMRERSRFVRHDGRWVYWGPLQPASYRRRGPAASSSGSGMSSGNTGRDTRSSDG
jgi:SEC-C motif-containing protein